MFNFDKTKMPTPEVLLKGRSTPMPVDKNHFVTSHPIFGPWPAGLEIAYFGLGCFWGAERKFWQQAGVYVTAVGYGAGTTPNPTYEEVCSGRTGQNEIVMVVFDPNIITFEGLVKVFFESHDPTSGMRQGGDIGTQYRSGIYPSNQAQEIAAQEAMLLYQEVLSLAGHGQITTEIVPDIIFYYAETYHQQYLAKNIDGYCGIGGLGVSCPIGLNV
jgi:peptide-methionine (S)-S-oxide reductase